MPGSRARSWMDWLGQINARQRVFDVYSEIKSDCKSATFSIISIFPGKLLIDQTAGHGLKGSQINIFSTEYRNKNYFLIENEDLTQLRHLRITEQRII